VRISRRSAYLAWAQRSTFRLPKCALRSESDETVCRAAML
jgi:hypothetical protein